MNLKSILYRRPRAGSPTWVSDTPSGAVARSEFFGAGLASVGVSSDAIIGATVAVSARALVTVSATATIGASTSVLAVSAVAVGSSAPQLTVSLQAALNDTADIAVGSVIGSNIFNILCVLGLTSMVTPGGLEVSATALQFDIRDRRPGRRVQPRNLRAGHPALF